jgi:hypothetical protein
MPDNVDAVCVLRFVKNMSRQVTRRSLFNHAFKKISKAKKVEPGTTGEDAVLFAISLTSRRNRRAYARDAAKAEFHASSRS